jgi:tetratricopeptide (TPR) repeat protein
LKLFREFALALKMYSEHHGVVTVYALTIFIGAFLLFQAQPLIGKYILPWFGGAPGVWTTCLLFFQVLLLGGYAYAHCSCRWLKPRRQAILHLALLVGALALLPIIPRDSLKPDGSGNPTLQIIGLLAMSIGLPYFVLSATAPLLQHWFSRTHPDVSPFRLYALSNLGSLLALISFPILFETHFTRTAQATMWGWGLCAYVVGCGLCVLRIWKLPPLQNDSINETGSSDNAPPTVQHRLLWLLLPACASVLLLATTNKMCQEVAVIPFLWVLPLSLYLLSFIICFDNPRWYIRFPFGLALLAAWIGICWALFKGVEAPLRQQLWIYSLGLFVCCMVCHGELYRLKPSPRHLTGFYLMIAAGGALGGVFVVVIAPVIFTDYFELQWALAFCGLLFAFVVARDQTSGPVRGWRSRLGDPRRLRLSGSICLWVSVAVLGIVLWQQAHNFSRARVGRTRNFYGVLSVFRHDDDQADLHYLELSHGRVAHGLQFTDPQRALRPTLYYSENSGVGLTLRRLPKGQHRIGIIGLGVGTLASYAQPGDYVRFFEINPEVERMARAHFSYLTNCRGKLEVTLGDARLSLEREPPQNFDLLVVDAFNSDAIPVHLLTREAFAIYERHLKTNGMIAMHVSNKSMNLEPVVMNLARQFDQAAATIDHIPPPNTPWIVSSIWILLSRDRASINNDEISLAARPPRTNSINVPLWTDDYASVFQILHHQPNPEKESEFTWAEIQRAHELYEKGDFAGAVAHFRQALRKQPESLVVLNNLALLLATCPDASLRDYTEAIRLGDKACQLTHYHTTVFVGTLAAVYSEAGRFSDAVYLARKASALAAESGDSGALMESQKFLELYRAGRPYHDALK